MTEPTNLSGHTYPHAVTAYFSESGNVVIEYLDGSERIVLLSEEAKALVRLILRHAAHRSEGMNQ